MSSRLSCRMSLNCACIYCAEKELYDAMGNRVSLLESHGSEITNLSEDPAPTINFCEVESRVSESDPGQTLHVEDTT